MTRTSPSLNVSSYKTKKKLLLHQIDTTINFGSIKNFLSPAVPEDLTKFKTPKVE